MADDSGFPFDSIKRSDSEIQCLAFVELGAVFDFEI